MAKVYPTPVTASVNGTTLALSAPTASAGNGDAVPANSIVYVLNGAGSPITITIKMTGVTVDGQTVADKSVIVGATTGALIGPFTNNMKQNTGADANLVYLEYSSVTTVTRAVINTPW